ncbi:hypothetical protein M2132_001329 [Dysgonomonas sp. PH5-45]|uniref:hypothetical protein n=1 Tax=unclassified Dysgonomonas TaxID=2630389 RepID=UPI002473F4EF|nr:MULTISPECIES: hypothetical protein [unclassified Dysgonomonas]MDH6354992.1 hypothetical protein [Dysgonomonas sp. PH5-45]MDH6387884.1 hypothetical protein [Dysgonomonas sp. PH5-37]
MNYKLTILSLLAATAFASATAQDGFATKSLSIFKNGQSFVVKEGTVDAVNRQYKMSSQPKALFGTFWFSGENESITAVTNRIESFTEKQERKANSLLDILHANKGKQMTIYTTDKKEFTGTAEDFNLPEEVSSQLQVQKLQLSDKYGGAYDFSKIYTESVDPVLMIKMDSKWITLRPSDIQRIEFAENPNRTTTANILVQKPIITLHFKKNGAQKVRMMYLQNGLSWTPVYRLELKNDTEGRLSLQAEVKNHVEDIANTDIDFVIGVANFSAANAPATLLNLSASSPSSSMFARSSSTQMFSNAIMSKQMDYDYEEEMVSMPDYKITTSENEDLYFYTARGITLPNGSTANFPLLEKTVKIRHLYTCNLSASAFKDYRVHNVQDGEYEDRSTNTIGGGNQSAVNHYVEVTNSTENPLTSGPMLIVQDKTQKALAQSTLYFTPKGSASQVFITNSPDVSVKDSEEITNTKLNAKKIDGYNYALLTIKGTVWVNNTKSKDVEMELSKVVAGKIVSAPDKYKVSVTDNSSNLNKQQKLSFGAKLKANSKQTFEYTYQMYSRQYN